MNNRRALWTNALTKRSRPEKKALAVQSSNFCGKVLGIDPSLRGSGFAVLEAVDARSIHYVTSLTLKSRYGSRTSHQNPGCPYGGAAVAFAEGTPARRIRCRRRRAVLHFFVKKLEVISIFFLNKGIGM